MNAESPKYCCTPYSQSCTLYNIVPPTAARSGDTIGLWKLSADLPRVCAFVDAVLLWLLMLNRCGDNSWEYIMEWKKARCCTIMLLYVHRPWGGTALVSSQSGCNAQLGQICCVWSWQWAFSHADLHQKWSFLEENCNPLHWHRGWTCNHWFRWAACMTTDIAKLEIRWLCIFQL